MPENTIAFQGWPGANSHLACLSVYPSLTVLPCTSFEETFAAVLSGQARLAMIPIDNTVAGRVADIHHLLPGSGLSIIGEHFQRVNHNLLAVPGTTIDDLTEVHSHVHALSQCRAIIRHHGLKSVVHADTAGAAEEIGRLGDPTKAAIGSTLAAETYGLAVLAADIEDADHNTTRFVIMTRKAAMPPRCDGPMITSFIFKVRNIPAALYKALGGFATCGVNMIKLESYMIGGHFAATQFYAEIEGHPDDRLVRLAIDELEFHHGPVDLIGVYPANPFRLEMAVGG